MSDLVALAFKRLRQTTLQTELQSVKILQIIAEQIFRTRKKRPGKQMVDTPGCFFQPGLNRQIQALPGFEQPLLQCLPIRHG